MNKKTIARYVTDLAMMVSFLVTAISGLAIKFFMPSGVRRGSFQEFLGLQKGFWTETHDIFGIILIVVVALHIIFSWNLFVCMTKNIFKKEKEVCEVSEKTKQ